MRDYVIAIGKALTHYGKEITILAWLSKPYFEHSSIKTATEKLRALSDADNKSTILKICLDAYQYFLQAPSKEYQKCQPSFRVYKALLECLRNTLCFYYTVQFEKLSVQGIILLRDHVDNMMKNGTSCFEPVIIAMIALEKVNLLSKNFNLILKNQCSKSLIRALIKLHDRKLLTQENIDAVNAHECPESLADAFKMLYAPDRSVPAMEGDREAIVKHIHPKELTWALFNFDDANFLPQEYRQRVIRSNDPRLVVDILILLYDATDLLTPANVCTALKDEQILFDVGNALNKFKKAGLLSGQKGQSNFDRLLHSDNRIFLCENFAWRKIPNDLWTPTLMNELMSLAQQENPKEQMQHYVDEFLIEKKFERDAFLAEKEFQPDFRFYINDLRNRKPSYAQRFQQFGLVAEQEFLCPISHGIINIPVFIQNQRVRHSYDFIYLVRAIQLHGKDPITRKPITLADIKPDKKLCDLMEIEIKQAELKQSSIGFFKPLDSPTKLGAVDNSQYKKPLP